MAALTVTRDDADHRYEGVLDGADGVAAIDYRLDEGTTPTTITMTRTEVPEGMRGEGVGGELVRQALDDVRERGEVLVAECPFVAGWLDEHEGYQDLRDVDRSVR